MLLNQEHECMLKLYISIEYIIRLKICTFIQQDSNFWESREETVFQIYVSYSTYLPLYLWYCVLHARKFVNDSEYLYSNIQNVEYVKHNDQSIIHRYT